MIGNTNMNTKHFILTIVWAIVIIIILWLVGQMMITAIEKEEIVECHKLVRYSNEQGDHFWITKEQAEMCKFRGVEVNARIID